MFWYKAIQNFIWTCINVQSPNRKSGKSHFWNNASWNWNGMVKIAILISASDKLAMKKLVTDLIIQEA